MRFILFLLTSFMKLYARYVFSLRADRKATRLKLFNESLKSDLLGSACAFPFFMLFSSAQKNPDRSRGLKLRLKLTLLETEGANVLHCVGGYFCVATIAFAKLAHHGIRQHPELTHL